MHTQTMPKLSMERKQKRKRSKSTSPKKRKNQNEDILHSPPSKRRKLSSQNTTNNSKQISANYSDYLSIYTDDRCLLHGVDDADEIFNERPSRLTALLEMIQNEGWHKNTRFISNISHTPTIEDIAGSYHDDRYLLDLQNICNKLADNEWHTEKGSDTYIVKQTLHSALISAGLVMEATEYVFDNQSPNKKNFAVVLNRPPGHHCDGKKYSGYCFINNTAVAIEKQLEEDTKILILDVDVHHGDGTQNIFYSEPNVLTISIHEYDGSFFPATGERGQYGTSRRHKAYGTNINIPLESGASDFDVLYVLRNLLWEIVEKYAPDICFYSVGTDGIANDKANNSTIFTPNLYGQIAFELQQFVDLIVVTTEGGYTKKYLADGMRSVLHGLTGKIADDKQYSMDLKNEYILQSTIETVYLTKSDLRRVYDIEYDPEEFEKIFSENFQNQSMILRSSSSTDGNGQSKSHNKRKQKQKKIEKKRKEKKKKKRKKQKKKKKNRSSSEPLFDVGIDYLFEHQLIDGIDLLLWAHEKMKEKEREKTKKRKKKKQVE